MNIKRLALILIAAIIALAVYFSFPNIAPQPRIVLSIMFFVGALWFTEAIPLHTTAIMIPFLLALFAKFTPQFVFAPFFDPIIALLFGGFVLAVAIQKYELDKRIAAALINFVGTKPRNFLLGIMSTAAFLSMWISNTATAALIIPIGVAVIAASGLKPLKSNYAKSVVLGIGFAATIGGTATLVGSPPNAITASILADAGIAVDFAGWAAHALPLAIVMIFIAWAVLSFVFKPEIKNVEKLKMQKRGLNCNQKATLLIFAATVALWITEIFHGVHYSVIAIVPVLAFYTIGLLNTKDLQKIQWDALLLVGGSLCLGVAIHSSGLDTIIAGALGSLIAGQPLFLTLLIIALFAIAFTAFVANTAGAAILVPIMIPLASALGVGVKELAIMVGIVVSFDFIVPVGTPPNAIAYSSGYVRVRDMVKAGLLISIAGALTASLFAMLW